MLVALHATNFFIKLFSAIIFSKSNYVRSITQIVLKPDSLPLFRQALAVYMIAFEERFNKRNFFSGTERSPDWSELVAKLPALIGL